MWGIGQKGEAQGPRSLYSVTLRTQHSTAAETMQSFDPV